MDGSNPILDIVIFVMFFIVNFIIYGFGAAIQNIGDGELEEIARKDTRISERVYKIKEKPFKFIDTVQVSSMFMMIIVGAYEINLINNNLISRIPQNITDLLGRPTICILLFAVMSSVLIFILLSLGILLPKRIGTHYSVSFACSLANIAYFIMIILTPITFLVGGLTGIILKIFGIDPRGPLENVTEEDIMSVINEGHEQGILLASEAEMINNIVEFGDKEARDIMTHRNGISAVDGELTLEEAVEFIVNENKSRFPTYIGDIDNIIGIINLRDVMVQYQNVNNRLKLVKDIDGLVRNATFIPETRKINILFKTMQSEKIHMAIVIDEYGQTSGIVAMEDILEEIVGNILDEYDEEECDIIKKEDGSFIIRGLTNLEDVGDAIGIEFEDGFETLNGFLISKFDRILSNDERPQITINGITYKILGVQNRMISSVQIIIPEH